MAEYIVRILHDTFRDTAVPTQILYSGGGPQFARFTQEFSREWGVRSVISSPHNRTILSPMDMLK